MDTHATAQGVLATNFRDNLTRIVRERDLDVAGLSAVSGISRPMYSFLLNARRAPSLQTAERVASGLYVPPWDMFRPARGEPCNLCHASPPQGSYCSACCRLGPAVFALLRSA